MDFGISLDPLAVPQRHTLDDSESDEESEQQLQVETEVFTVGECGKNKPSLEGKAVLVGVGGTASLFLRSFLSLREEPAFSLRTEADKTQEVFIGKGTLRDVTAFHDVEGASSCIACVHGAELRLEYCNHWTEKVFSQGMPSHVVVYVCQSLHKYFHSSSLGEEHTHVERELQSSSWPQKPLGQLLEPPNTLQGEAAGILTYCELHSVPCSVRILYASNSLTEKEKALCLLPSLREVATSVALPTGLSVKGEKDGELMVGRLQPKPKTDLATLYT